MPKNQRFSVCSHVVMLEMVYSTTILKKISDRFSIYTNLIYIMTTLLHLIYNNTFTLFFRDLFCSHVVVMCSHVDVFFIKNVEKMALKSCYINSTTGLV